VPPHHAPFTQPQASLHLYAPQAAHVAVSFFAHYLRLHQRLCWELQQAASASLSVNIANVEPAALAKCTLSQVEEQLAAFGISQAAAFVVSGVLITAGPL
jgi:hypothetical protein